MTGTARWIAGLLLFLTFSVGALGGMALEEALGIDWFEFLDEDSDEPEDSLLAGLDLDPRQRAEVEEILEQQEARLEDYWETRLPEIQAMMEESYDAIRGHLTAVQRATFDQRVRKLGGRVPEEARD